MHSTFMGLEISRRGLMSHQQALHVTGQNISNAENEEYTRQRVEITAMDPIYNPGLNRAETAGQLGQGSVVAQVERIRNSFIDDRIVAEKNLLGYWKSRNDFIYQVEQVYNEPSDQSIRSRMDAFWESWQELSKYPETRATREVVKEKANALSNEVRVVFRQLEDLRDDANRQIAARVELINNYGRSIRDLNERIMKSEALGDNPNDLMDKRDGLIEKLSQLVNISVSRSDKDETIVYIGSENLVQGEVFHPVETFLDPANNGYYGLRWAGSEAPVKPAGGELYGLVEIRDVVLRENINSVNALAANIVDLTNEVHRDGFGKNGETNVNFFNEIMVSDNVDGNHDLNNDGVYDVSAVFKVAGTNKLDASAAIGIAGSMTFVMNDEIEGDMQIAYAATDSVNDVMKRINDARMGVTAYLDHNNHLALKATIARDVDKKNFMIRHLEDSGQFLVGLTGILKESGPAGSFDYRRVGDIAKLLPDREHVTITPQYNPAAYIGISKDIDLNIDRIAAAKGKDIGGTGDYNTANNGGDGTNALAIARLRHGTTMVDSNATFNDYYISLISRIGSQGQEANDRIKNQDTLLTNLTNLRKSVSGVSLDEEMANMVQFQQAYNANARMISTFDKMLETIIRLGA